jgi:hypothetical protein
MLAYLYPFAYVFLTAISVVLIHDTSALFPPILCLFLSTFVAIVFFHVINHGQLKPLYAKAFQAKWQWLKVMLMVVGMWFSCFLGPTYLHPSIFVLIYFSFLCVLGSLFSLKIQYNLYVLISAIGVSLCTIFLVQRFMLQHSMVSWQEIMGMALGLMGGAFSFLYNKQSHHMMKKHDLTVTQLLTVRFWLVELVCLPLLKPDQFLLFNTHIGFYIVIISLFSLILPAYLATKSVAMIGPEKSSIAFGLLPSLTYIIQNLLDLSMIQADEFVLYLLVGLFIMLPHANNLLKNSPKGQY